MYGYIGQGIKQHVCASRQHQLGNGLTLTSKRDYIKHLAFLYSHINFTYQLNSLAFPLCFSPTVVFLTPRSWQPINQIMIGYFRAIFRIFANIFQGTYQWKTPARLLSSNNARVKCLPVEFGQAACEFLSYSMILTVSQCGSPLNVSVVGIEVLFTQSVFAGVTEVRTKQVI